MTASSQQLAVGDTALWHAKMARNTGANFKQDRSK